MEQNAKRKILKTIGFMLLFVLLFGIVLVLMISSDERWFGYLILAVCAGLLIALRRTELWHGWRVPLYWILALAIVWSGLFAGQPMVNIQPYTAMNLEQPSASYQLLLNNVTIVDTQNGQLTSNMSILSEDGEIIGIAPAGSIKAGEDTKIVDAAGKYAVPGYLNMHMHVLGDEKTPEIMSLLLANGVTGFRQMSGSAGQLKEWRSGAFTSSSEEPALLAMPGDVLTPINAPTPKVAEEFVREQQKEGAGFIKAGGVTPEVFDAVQAEANKLNLPFVGHVLPDMDLKKASENGFYSVEHFGINNGALISASTDESILRAEATGLPSITSNPVFVYFMKIKGLRDFVNEQVVSLAIKTSGGKEDLAQLQHLIDSYSEEKAIQLADVFVENNTWQSPTLVRMHLGLFSNDSDKTIAQGVYDLYLKLAKTYDSKGVKMLVGTDEGGGANWRNAGNSIHQEFDELEKAGISPLHVLQMATFNGAEFLGRLDDMGTVEAGKNADIVLLDANPLESVQNLHKIDAVIRAGAYHGKEELNSIKKMKDSEQEE
ncbi:amidohydrolase family protein [Paenibacillus sp. S150]|uniref:amidohydrolase family protein n=1 Tax=Paenibacillus sp. S150 TaxID=2749826 RepID=UPI001C59A52D|nr:amidohydrolase family protein [Paenibacillus sp. S150]MBW4082615.1 amidohydrolase family protein [Paenibacillus sp. S150]